MTEYAVIAVDYTYHVWPMAYIKRCGRPYLYSGTKESCDAEALRLESEYK